LKIINGLKQDESRDRDDFGRIIAALMDHRELSPTDAAAIYLSKDLRKIRSDQGPRRLIFPWLHLLPDAPIIGGGSGVVFKVTNIEIPSLHYALKIPRPSLFQGELKEVGVQYGRTAAEYLNHAPLSHENIARVITAVDLNVVLTSTVPIVFRAVLMEWVEDALPLIDYLLTKPMNHFDVANLLIQSFSALNHLHAHNLIHWDLKSDNFLVDGRGIVKLMDIGNARRTDDPKREHVAFSSRWNLPQQLFEKLIGTGDSVDSSRRTRIELDDLCWDDPWLDLWMIARELNRLFGADELVETFDRCAELPKRIAQVYENRHLFLSSVFPDEDNDAQFALKYIRLMLRRLLHPKLPISRKYYLNARQFALDLRKLEPEFGAAQSISELQAIPQSVLRLPHSGNAPYTARVGRIINSQLIVRLSRHLQLGTLMHVYPGGTHRRSEHTVGVFHTVAQYVRSLYADRTDPFWRLEIDPRDVNALLLAALLHDVGHVALGHFVEEMSGLVSGRAHEDYVTYLLDESPESIKTRGIRFSTRYMESVESDRTILIKLVKRDWITGKESPHEFMAYVAEILRPSTHSSVAWNSESILLKEESETIKREILHTIIDSAIDADKLDYLLRDAHHCGVKYADGIDIDRFFQSLTTVQQLDEIPFKRIDALGSMLSIPRACIGISKKGILPVESILIARYQMFGSVYWHHTARAETAMLQYAVMEFVGAEETGMDERLEELLEVFRSNTDHEAICWFMGRISSWDRLSEKKRISLTEVCQTLLGERHHLYRTVFELRYEPEVGHKLTNGTAKDVYQALLRQAELREMAQSPAAYITAARRLRIDFCERLSRRLGDFARFEDGDVLIDVPPTGKDQIENIFVAGLDRPRAIQELSPIANAVRDTFAYWARKVRVFLSPQSLAQMEKHGYNRVTLGDKCWAVLQEIEKSKDPQLEFPLDSASS
jgi:HD superfamily phosphohydrolase